jgi:hypothetical protein
MAHTRCGGDWGRKMYLGVYATPGDFTSALTDLFVFQSDGKLGLGNMSPAKRLEVRDTSAQLRLSYDGSNYTDLTTTSSGYLQLSPSGKWVQLPYPGSSTPGGLRLTIGNTDALLWGNFRTGWEDNTILSQNWYLDSSGNNVFVNSGQPAVAIAMGYADIFSMRFYVGDTNGAPPQERMRIQYDGKVGIGTTSPAYQLQLSTDSAAKPSTNTWTVPSDERLKKDIILADLDRCYEIVRDLPLKRFTWRDDVYTAEQVPDRSKLGWIAQDVEKIFPKAVTITEHKISDDEIIEDCRGLNADQLYAVLWGAVQKLQLKVAALEATS